VQLDEYFKQLKDATLLFKLNETDTDEKELL
jgi:hypothetical protein